jgi:hypothetical protein
MRFKMPFAKPAGFGYVAAVSNQLNTTTTI